ncbi:uncharacterized protein CLUP02_11459 [Colletotrichum lupini]|uniref:Uncharacterized protein n=1 Tax=Colletotrichum lupini TaxID=145971 RepID=A0A9Q8SZG2_9PEZI|nr:uncharacterized protein CLUP02_11459 [Colletotrichum lupini]UQC85960.1 hypothetical protein CLUP02_11459 [Colletotrichum lupini]
MSSEKTAIRLELLLLGTYESPDHAWFIPIPPEPTLFRLDLAAIISTYGNYCHSKGYHGQNTNPPTNLFAQLLTLTNFGLLLFHVFSSPTFLYFKQVLHTYVTNEHDPDDGFWKRDVLAPEADPDNSSAMSATQLNVKEHCGFVRRIGDDCYTIANSTGLQTWIPVCIDASRFIKEIPPASIIYGPAIPQKHPNHLAPPINPSVPERNMCNALIVTFSDTAPVSALIVADVGEDSPLSELNCCRVHNAEQQLRDDETSTIIVATCKPHSGLLTSWQSLRVLEDELCKQRWWKAEKLTTKHKNCDYNTKSYPKNLIVWYSEWLNPSTGVCHPVKITQTLGTQCRVRGLRCPGNKSSLELGDSSQGSSELLLMGNKPPCSVRILGIQEMGSPQQKCDVDKHDEGLGNI